MNIDDKPLISVVVPIYNVEEYVGKCIESLIRQTFTSIEIVLVDDGSTDKSFNICKKYQEQDCRIKLFHKANGGLSDARNYGVLHCECKYVVFVDSDDYVDTSYIDNLWAAHEKYKSAGLIVAGVIRQDEAGNELSMIGDNTTNILSAKQGIAHMCYGNTVPVYAYAKLYKRESLLKYPYPVGKIHEDVWTTYLLIDDAKLIVTIEDKNYHYIQRGNSILHSKFSPKYYDAINGAKQLLVFVQKNYPDITNAAIARLLIESNALLHRASSSLSDFQASKKIVRKYLKGYWKNGLSDKHLNHRVRLEMILFRISPLLYRYGYRIYSKAAGR